MKEEQLIEELKKLGWKWGYVYGHGDSEPAGEGDFVIADLEKTMVLIPPKELFDEPVPLSEYF